MSLDLLALFNGKSGAAKAGSGRTTPAVAAPAVAPSTGSRAVGFTAGSYVVDTPAPSPAFIINTSRDVTFAPSTTRRLYGSPGTGYYMEERVTPPYAPGPAPAPGPVPARPAAIPATFYVRPSSYTDAKTTADVALNQRLYTALVRSTK
jgi:hypothetical protein